MDPGLVDGQHYSAYTDRVRQLKRAGDLASAERLLLRLIEAAEAEAETRSWGVAPWYYEQLAIVYRKRRDSAREMAILERYERQSKAPGARPPRLATRLAKRRSKRVRKSAA